MFLTTEILLTAGVTELAAETVEVAGAALEVSEAALKSMEAVQLESPFSMFDTELVHKSWLESSTLEMAQEATEVKKLTPQQHLETARGWIKAVNPLYTDHLEEGSASMYNWGSCAVKVEENLLATETNANALYELSYEGTLPVIESAERIRELNSVEGLQAALGREARFIKKDAILSKMQELGPGSHVVAGVTREPYIPALDGILDRPDYWFNLYYDGEKLYTLDGHKGNIVEGLQQYKNEDQWMIFL